MKRRLKTILLWFILLVLLSFGASSFQFIKNNFGISSNCKNVSEMDSWGRSLPVLANVLRKLPDNIKNDCEIVLEAGYCTDERADVVICGMKDGKAAVIIIENKQWSELYSYEPAGDACLKDPYHDSMYVEHPCYQVGHYRYILNNMNSFIQDNNVQVYTAVFMHNAKEEERSREYGPFDKRFGQGLKDNPVFVGEYGTNETYTDLTQYIADRIKAGSKGLAKAIYTAKRKESQKYKNTLSHLFDKDDARFLNLLDDNQASIFEEIRQRVFEKRNEKTVFIIEGDPGTGKTFVAAAFIAYLYKHQKKDQNYSVKLVLKNKDPRRALQRMGMPNTALTYGLKGIHTMYDCLICDESHRMLEHVWKGEDDRDNIDVIIGQSNVSVFFYDSKQRVHINYYVTKERIISRAKQAGIREENIIKRKLEYQHRCLNSDHFMQLIDRILYEPELGLDGIEPFTEDENYLVRMVSSPRELFYKIKELNDKRAKGMNSSRVLAGMGRTDGKDWEWQEDNTPLELRKTLGAFRNDNGNKYVWNLHNYPYPDTFASDNRSVGLVGCLDTSQGLDFEYVGLIFSPDIIYDENDGIVKINLDGHMQGDPNLNIRHHRNEDQLLKTIIRNTYRVLASRGAKGCFIYCSDEKLQKYLGSLIPTIDVDVPDDYSTYPTENRSSCSMNTENIMYIGNSNNRSFHFPDCKYAPKDPKKRVEFRSREETVNAGFRPCPTCNP